MSFQSYLQNIKAKTGKGPEGLPQARRRKRVHRRAEHQAGGSKRATSSPWLKQDFELGHGHAMAIYALLKGNKSEDSE